MKSFLNERWLISSASSHTVLATTDGRLDELRCSMITQVLIQELAIQYGNSPYQQCYTHPSCFSKLQMQRRQFECDFTPVSPETNFWGGHARRVVTKKTGSYFKLVALTTATAWRQLYQNRRTFSSWTINKEWHQWLLYQLFTSWTCDTYLRDVWNIPFGTSV